MSSKRHGSTLGAFETSMDLIFNIVIFAVSTMAWTLFNPCCADTMLSIVVRSEPVHTTTSVHLSLILSCLALNIFPTTQNRNAAIALPVHSLCHHIHYQLSVFKQTYAWIDELMKIDQQWFCFLMVWAKKPEIRIVGHTSIAQQYTYL